ncbi:hypothetical protein C5Y93_22910 [Blastopirellula marina]|uniref:Uncharacterized protein n=1 Tax=Blastopirellula marina TaxID=124 RepID=A0A2S8GGB8_9BACT|nr:hypothetical protein C5Y93_22910 [Blastopirellula marina]
MLVIVVLAILLAWLVDHVQMHNRIQAEKIEHDCKYQAWHFLALSTYLFDTTGRKARVTENGIEIERPDGVVTFCPRPSELDE